MQMSGTVKFVYCNCNSIIKLIVINKNNNLYCIISEYAAQGCLYDYLTNNRLNFDQILRWSTEIALGKQIIVCVATSVGDAPTLWRM